MSRVYVGNIPFKTTEADLEDLFADYGGKNAKIINDRETGRSRGFGFIECSSVDEMKRAIRDLHETDFGGRLLIVSEAHEKQGGGQGGGRGNGRNQNDRGDGRRDYGDRYRR